MGHRQKGRRRKKGRREEEKALSLRSVKQKLDVRQCGLLTWPDSIDMETRCIMPILLSKRGDKYLGVDRSSTEYRILDRVQSIQVEQ
jgi:hypothetical protein